MSEPGPVVLRAECGCVLKVVSGLPVLSQGVLEIVKRCKRHA